MKSANLAMQEIDRPFRPDKAFGVVWLLLLVPTVLFASRREIGPWYSVAAFIILVPIFATFLLYGPVLLAKQVLRSGGRGIFVLRVLLSITCVATLFFGGLLVSGYYTESSARLLGFAFAVAATIYLNWQLNQPSSRPR